MSSDDLVRLYRIHGGMPVILDPADYDRWLNRMTGKALLKPFRSERVARYPVSPAVGNVGNTGPELIERID